MGNKSKQAQGLKWAQQRNVTAARLPKSSRSWDGLVAPSPSKGMTRRLSVTLRTQQVPQVNTGEQPWQKRERKRREQVLSGKRSPPMHPLARREAREARKAAAMAEKAA